MTLSDIYKPATTKKNNVSMSATKRKSVFLRRGEEELPVELKEKLKDIYMEFLNGISTEKAYRILKAKILESYAQKDVFCISDTKKSFFFFTFN